MLLRPASTTPAFRSLLTAGACACCFVAPSFAADVELVVDLGNSGALSLRSTTAGPLDIAGYRLTSAAGQLADTGDETLAGQFSALLFDVDNAGSDEVSMWTLDPNTGLFGPDLSLPASPASQALNLAWLGTTSGNALTDLVLEYGVSSGQPPVIVADIIVLLAGITGDYNASGQVEQGDLDLVLQNWGDVTPPVPAGWVNDLPVGQIEQSELDKVLQNWGSTSAPDFSGSSVPEPALLAAAALIGLGLRPRPKKSSQNLENTLHKSPRIG